MKRYFWKCLTCLTVMATEEENGYPQYEKRECGVCGGKLECMGRVHGASLVTEAERCPCDERCTAAQGPSCECKCGGVNHGTNMLVTVFVNVRGIPTLTPATPEAVEAARKRAEELRAAVEAATLAVNEAYADLIQWKKTGQYHYPTHAAWYAGPYKATCAINKAKNLKVHSLRMKRLAAVEKAANQNKLLTFAPVSATLTVLGG